MVFLFTLILCLLQGPWNQNAHNCNNYEKQKFGNGGGGRTTSLEAGKAQRSRQGAEKLYSQGLTFNGLTQLIQWEGPCTQGTLKNTQQMWKILAAPRPPVLLGGAIKVLTKNLKRKIGNKMSIGVLKGSKLSLEI